MIRIRFISEISCLKLLEKVQKGTVFSQYRLYTEHHAKFNKALKQGPKGQINAWLKGNWRAGNVRAKDLRRIFSPFWGKLREFGTENFLSRAFA
jgi:hypothetical protein